MIGGPPTVSAVSGSSGPTGVSWPEDPEAREVARLYVDLDREIRVRLGKCGLDNPAALATYSDFSDEEILKELREICEVSGPESPDITEADLDTFISLVKAARTYHRRVRRRLAAEGAVGQAFRRAEEMARQAQAVREKRLKECQTALLRSITPAEPTAPRPPKWPTRKNPEDPGMTSEAASAPVTESARREVILTRLREYLMLVGFPITQNEDGEMLDIDAPAGRFAIFHLVV